MAIPMHIRNFKSISQKTAEKSLENKIFTKGTPVKVHQAW